jgi:hypothetical protein
LSDVVTRPGGPQFVRVTYTSGAVSHNGRPGWQRRQRGEIAGWTDNLDEKAGSVMVYGRDEVAALHFWEIERVELLGGVRD